MAPTFVVKPSRAPLQASAAAGKPCPGVRSPQCRLRAVVCRPRKQAQAGEAQRTFESGEAFRRLVPLLCGMLLGDAGLAVLLRHAVHAGLLPVMGRALAHVQQLASGSAHHAALLATARDWLYPAAAPPSADATDPADMILLLCT
ncbi:hypothetical protein ABPG75_010882 [Micractinium tetrahymenae]